MTPEEIAEKWIAENGEIRPVNPYCNCATKQNCENIKCEEFEFDVVIKHTYPCPTLADGEYRGEDLEIQLQRWIVVYNKWEDASKNKPGYNYRTIIRLKQTPAIDAGETVEEVPEYIKNDSHYGSIYRAGQQSQRFRITALENELKESVKLEDVVGVLENLQSQSEELSSHLTLHIAITQIKQLAKDNEKVK